MLKVMTNRCVEQQPMTIRFQRDVSYITLYNTLNGTDMWLLCMVLKYTAEGGLIAGLLSATMLLKG